jgi:hydrogenase maturation protease
MGSSSRSRSWRLTADTCAIDPLWTGRTIAFGAEKRPFPDIVQLHIERGIRKTLNPDRKRVIEPRLFERPISFMLPSKERHSEGQLFPRGQDSPPLIAGFCQLRPRRVYSRSKQMKSSRPPILVLGLGNELLKDDAVGIRVAEELPPVFPPDVEIRSTSLFGLSLLDELIGREKVLVIDSYIPGENSPPEIRELRLDEAGDANAPSPHFVGLGEIREIMRGLKIGFPREVRILAIPVVDPITFSTEMTPEVAGRVSEAVERACQIIRGWISIGN